MSLSNETIAAVVGAVFGAGITYFFALKLADKQFQHLKEISRLDAWRSAAHEFVAAFAPELAKLRSGASLTGDVMDLMRVAYTDRHAKAVAVFIHYLPAQRRAAFRQDWLRHCYGTKQNGAPESPEHEESLPHDDLLYLHFSNEWHEPNAPNARVRAIKSIERLLSYAGDA